MSKKHPTYAEIAIVNYLVHNDPTLDGTQRPSNRALLKATFDAARACTTLAQWAIAAAELGYHPTQAEFAKYWGMSTATTERDLVRFRIAFPGEQSPHRLADHVREVMRERTKDKALVEVQTLPAPSTLASGHLALAS